MPVGLLFNEEGWPVSGTTLGDASPAFPRGPDAIAHALGEGARRLLVSYSVVVKTMITQKAECVHSFSARI